MTPEEIISQAVSEQSVRSERADSLAASLVDHILSNNSEGMSNVVNSAISDLEADATGNREEEGDDGAMDVGDRQQGDGVSRP